MANPVIDLLEGRARAALPFIQAGVASGLNATQITDALSAAGLGFRRTNMLSVIRAVANTQLTRPYINSVGLSARPDPSRFAEAQTFLSRQYSYLVRVTGTHPVTGERMTQYISVATDEVLSKQDALDEALSMIEENASAYQLSPDEAVVENAFVNPLFAP